MFKRSASNERALTTDMLQDRSPEEVKTPTTDENARSITPEDEMNDGKNIALQETTDDSSDVPRSKLHETGSDLGASIALSTGNRSGGISTPLVTGSSILSTARITVACTGGDVPIPSSKPSIFSISSILGRPGKFSLPERGRLRELGSAKEERDSSCRRLKGTVVDFEPEERSSIHGVRRGLPVFRGDGFMERQPGRDLLIPENWFFWYQQHQKQFGNIDPSTF